MLLRNIVEQEGIEIMDASHGQVVLGNVILVGGPLTVASGITATVLDGNVILPVLVADANSCPEIDVPASPYLADAPTFYCSCSWPMLADGQLVNPAAQRALGIPTTPTPTPAGTAGTMAAINRLLLP